MTASPSRLLESHSPVARNALAGGTAAVLGSALYYFSAFLVDPHAGRSLATPLDDAIPFMPASAYAYASIYTVMFFPAFVVRSYEVFRRTLIALMGVLFVSMLLFVAFPVSAVELRPPLDHLDTSVFHHWGMHLIYFLDPPTNLFPSLHLSVAAVATLATAKADRRYAIVPALLATAIGISILTTKQHYLADGVAGMCLAVFMIELTFRGYRIEDEADAQRIFGPRSVWAFLAFHVCVYLGPLLLFLTGWEPWD